MPRDDCQLLTIFRRVWFGRLRVDNMGCADYVNTTPILHMATKTAASTSLLTLKKSQLPPALKSQTGNLYRILSRTPTGGVGTEVHQLRWSEKQISNSYWVITRSKFKCGGNHGKAWGQLYWKGLLSLTNLAIDSISYFQVSLWVPVRSLFEGLWNMLGKMVVPTRSGHYHRHLQRLYKKYATTVLALEYLAYLYN